MDGRFLFFAPSYAARRASKLGLTHLIGRVFRELRLASTLPGDRVLAVVASSRARDIRAVSASLRFLSSTSWGDLEVASLWRSTSGFLPRLPSGRGRFPSARMARGICAPRLRPWWPPRRSFSLLVLPSLRGRSPLLVPLPPQGLGADGHKVYGGVFQAEAFLVLGLCLLYALGGGMGCRMTLNCLTSDWTDIGLLVHSCWSFFSQKCVYAILRGNVIPVSSPG